MKKGLFVVVAGLITIVCASAVSLKAAYTDDVIAAELVVDDNDWVILTIKNNSASQIQLLVDKMYYSNIENAENTILVPLDENINPGRKAVNIPIRPGRIMSQKLVAPAYVKYKRGKVDNIDNWTPRSRKKIKTAIFDFEYEIEGETRRFSFEGNLFS